MIKAQEGAKEIRRLQDDVLSKLKAQLADTKGIFKGRERKALTEQIGQTEKEIAQKLDRLPDILKSDGYPDVQAFMRTFREMESVVEQYTVTLPSGNARPAGNRKTQTRSSADRPKGRAYSNICMRYRREISRNPPKDRNGNSVTSLLFHKYGFSLLNTQGIFATNSS